MKGVCGCTLCATRCGEDSITCQQTVTADGFGFIYTIGSSFEEDHDGAKSETSYTITLKVTFHKFDGSLGTVDTAVVSQADYDANFNAAMTAVKAVGVGVGVAVVVFYAFPVAMTYLGSLGAAEAATALASGLAAMVLSVKEKLSSK